MNEEESHDLDLELEDYVLDVGSKGVSEDEQ